MPSLREEITKTFTRLAQSGDWRSAEISHPEAPDPREGRVFGIYEIVRRIGSGGMGQVYLATDTRLGRRVALKFLAPGLVADQLSLLRLVQEARAASALNHPNILTIYDVGQLEGEHFIVSEFVDGITLRTALQQNAISPEAAIEIACQVASALDAAHQAGVIHRDLKPTNIMLRPDGYVKVIDFGLAKRLIGSPNDTQVIQAELTRPGTTVGTAEYMSPEQARAEEVDSRTDIWSLGIILFEMLFARRPFEGPTSSHILVAIQEQPLRLLPKEEREVLPGVENILERALAKDLKNRYQNAGEMLRDLQVAGGISPLASRARIVPAASKRRRHTVRVIAFAVSLLIAVIAAGLLVWWSTQRPAWLQLEPLRQLTFNGRTQLATISPDGKYLAYTVGQPDGEQALYLKQINSTADEIKIRPRLVSYKGLTFFPDSQTLYVVEKDTDAGVGRLYELPVIGQPTGVPVLLHIDGPVSFSPSGDEIAYVDVATVPHKLMISSRDGQRQRVLLAVSDAIMLLRPAWSPDGKKIAVMLFRDHPNSTGAAILDVVKLDGTESRRVIPNWQRIGHLRWTPDSKSILTDVGTYSDPNRSRIHQVAVETGTDQVLTNDLASYRDISLTATGAQLTAIKKDAKTALWVSRPKDFLHGEPTPAQAESDPSLSWADDDHIVVDSHRNGFPNLALLDIANQSFAALTNEQHAEQAAAAIPRTGGKSFVFASNRSGEFHIWRFDSDANRYQQLTFGSSYDEQPSVSPDGRWVVYTSWSHSTPHIMKVPAIGGQPKPLLLAAAHGPQVSPDGNWIACYLQKPLFGKSLEIVPMEGAAPPRLIPAPGGPFRWSPDGASLTVVRTSGIGVSNAWNVPLDGRAPSPLTDFDDQTIIALAWAPSGDRLACLRETIGSDVTLFKNGKGR